MNPLIISTSDIDGGAARAAYRLHQSLQANGTNSQMLVRAKFSVGKAVTGYKPTISKLGPSLDQLPLQLYPNRKRTMYSLQWFPDAIATKVAQIAPDIINLHWFCNSYLKIETLTRLNKPLVWTLHDMWAFTGGCHYSEECDRYINSCGACPQLKSNRSWDLSRWVWQRKLKAWQNLNLTIVSPSTWLAERAKASSLFKNFRVETIPHGLDTETYKPVERKVARQLLNLPQDKQLILFGASSGAMDDLRKGFHLLYPALQNLSKAGWQERVELVIFGASAPENPIDLGFNVRYLGRLHDDVALALVYSAADVTLVPSMQEAYGQTASESIACGTPVVAFEVTGLKDIVSHQQDGYLAKPFAVDDLERGIAWVLEDRHRHQQLSDRAHAKAELEFALKLQAHRYLSLFTELVEARQHQK